MESAETVLWLFYNYFFNLLPLYYWRAHAKIVFCPRHSSVCNSVSVISNVSCHPKNVNTGSLINKMCSLKGDI